MQLSLKEAFQIAVEVHGDHLDKGGDPYLFHILRVAEKMETDEEMVVAILHDALEDCNPEDRQTLYSRICLAYGMVLACQVGLLTRDESEPYMDYIQRLAGSHVAVKVKLSDLADNMRRERLRKLAPDEANRLLDRYEKAYSALTGRLWQHEDAEAEA